MEYSDVESRIQSYNNIEWMSTYKNIFTKIENFAEAGFYSIKHRDYVKCFKCGGGLCNWDPFDDPWVEHAIYYPNCTYLNENKSIVFIECVQEVYYKKKDNNKIINKCNYLIKNFEVLKINDFLLCKLCFNKNINVVLIPCGHTLSCYECSEKLITCPICKIVIQIKQKIYFC